MGWIKLDRKILDHWLWGDKPFSAGQAWIDLLLLADHQDKKFLNGNTLVDGKRGEVHRSMLNLADRWGWSRKKVKRFLDGLESEQMVSQQVTTKGTTITIVKYVVYQGSGATKGTTKAQQKHNGGTTEAQQKHTNKNIKNIEEDLRKKEGGCAAISPSGINPNYEPEGYDPMWEYYKETGRI